ncbi:MAG: four helix bundle protein [Bacteroidota bacterium]|nr:four helix bundle protein [Bacteroidota bacterium]
MNVDGNSFDNMFDEEKAVGLRAKVTTYRDLIVWQRAMQLVEGVYNVTKRLPDSEKLAFASHLNSAVVIIPAKIAEGWGRKNTKNYLQLLKTARASLFTTETYLIVLKNVDLVTAEEETKLLGYVDEVKKMLNGLIKSLNNKLKTSGGNTNY